jgi:hypothetical protein
MPITMPAIAAEERPLLGASPGAVVEVTPAVVVDVDAATFENPVGAAVAASVVFAVALVKETPVVNSVPHVSRAQSSKPSTLTTNPANLERWGRR